ncbi:MAG TPA: hypothetical protein VGP02_13055 [Mycobacteriales bacterium]|jgi:hypothetical protein|nr:hypothetical protein [Mycobacteriales bacterium]
MTNEGTPPPQPSTPDQPYSPPSRDASGPPQAAPPLPRSAPPRQERRVGLVIAIVAGVLLLLCGGGTAAVLALGAAASDDQTAVYDQSVDISDRTGDPKPLTTAEVFPGKTLTANDRAYKVLTAENLTACATGAHGRTVAAVTHAGCTQVVRATVVDPSGKYVATVGLVNLKDAAAADAVRASAAAPNEGSFTPFKVAGTAAAEFGDEAGFISSGAARGHYYAYVVVGLASNREPSMADPAIDTVLGDLQEAVVVPVDDRES